MIGTMNINIAPSISPPPLALSPPPTPLQQQQQQQQHGQPRCTSTFSGVGDCVVVRALPAKVLNACDRHSFSFPLPQPFINLMETSSTPSFPPSASKSDEIFKEKEREAHFLDDCLPSLEEENKNYITTTEQKTLLRHSDTGDDDDDSQVSWRHSSESECQLPKHEVEDEEEEGEEIGTANRGGCRWWTSDSCGDGTVGEAHGDASLCLGQVIIGTVQVLIGGTVYAYPLYGSKEQCHLYQEKEEEEKERRKDELLWVLKFGDDHEWETPINSDSGEAVTMSGVDGDKGNMAALGLSQPSSPPPSTSSSSSSSVRPQPSNISRLQSSLYGFKIANSEHKKVKNLIPLFNNSKSTSARDVNNSVTYRVKGDNTWQNNSNRAKRNSDVCDMYMYRGSGDANEWVDDFGGGGGVGSGGGGGAGIIKLCGVSLGSPPSSPDPSSLFRPHTLPRRSAHLRLSSLPPSPQPVVSPLACTPQSVADFPVGYASAPMSPRLPQVLDESPVDEFPDSVVGDRAVPSIATSSGEVLPAIESQPTHLPRPSDYYPPSSYTPFVFPSVNSTPAVVFPPHTVPVTFENVQNKENLLCQNLSNVPQIRENLEVFPKNNSSNWRELGENKSGNVTVTPLLDMPEMRTSSGDNVVMEVNVLPDESSKRASDDLDVTENTNIISGEIHKVKMPLQTVPLDIQHDCNIESSNFSKCKNENDIHHEDCAPLSTEVSKDFVEQMAISKIYVPKDNLVSESQLGEALTAHTPLAVNVRESIYVCNKMPKNDREAKHVERDSLLLGEELPMKINKKVIPLNEPQFARNTENVNNALKVQEDCSSQLENSTVSGQFEEPLIIIEKDSDFGIENESFTKMEMPLGQVYLERKMNDGTLCEENKLGTTQAHETFKSNENDCSKDGNTCCKVKHALSSDVKENDSQSSVENKGQLSAVFDEAPVIVESKGPLIIVEDDNDTAFEKEFTTEVDCPLTDQSAKVKPNEVEIFEISPEEVNKVSFENEQFEYECDASKGTHSFSGITCEESPVASELIGPLIIEEDEASVLLDKEPLVAITKLYPQKEVNEAGSLYKSKPEDVTECGQGNNNEISKEIEHCSVKDRLFSLAKLEPVEKANAKKEVSTPRIIDSNVGEEKRQFSDTRTDVKIGETSEYVQSECTEDKRLSNLQASDLPPPYHVIEKGNAREKYINVHEENCRVNIDDSSSKESEVSGKLSVASKIEMSFSNSVSEKNMASKSEPLPEISGSCNLVPKSEPLAEILDCSNLAEPPVLCKIEPQSGNSLVLSSSNTRECVSVGNALVIPNNKAETANVDSAADGIWEQDSDRYVKSMKEGSFKEDPKRMSELKTCQAHYDNKLEPSEALSTDICMLSGELTNKVQSRENSISKEGTLGRPGGISERAALITRQQMSSRRTRTTHFPLDIVCNTKMQYQQTRQKLEASDSSNVARHRLSSLGHVQPLVLDIVAAGGGTVRSKSASRIGSGHLKRDFGESMCKTSTEGAEDLTKNYKSSKTSEHDKGSQLPSFPCPAVAPLDDALTNRIKLTIDSCTKTPSPTTNPPTKFAIPDSKSEECHSKAEHGSSIEAEGKLTPDSENCSQGKRVNGKNTTSPTCKIFSAGSTSDSTLNACADNDNINMQNNNEIESETASARTSTGNEPNNTSTYPLQAASTEENCPSLTSMSSLFPTKVDHNRTSLAILETNLLYIDEGESNTSLTEARNAQSLKSSNSLKHRPCKEDKSAAIDELPSNVCAVESDEASMICEDILERSVRDSKFVEQIMGEESKTKHKEILTKDSAVDLEPEIGHYFAMKDEKELDLHDHKNKFGCEALELEKKAKSEDQELVEDIHQTESDTQVSCDAEIELNTQDIVNDIHMPFELKSSSVQCKSSQDLVEDDAHSTFEVEPSKSSPTPVPETVKLVKQLLSEILEDVFYISQNRNSLLKDDSKSNNTLNENIVFENDTLDDVIRITVVDTEVHTKETPQKVLMLGREESVEEYEQALEVVTPDPGHGFSHSTASVATVVRVDTPNYPQTCPCQDDEEIDDIFVDAREDVNDAKHGEAHHQQIHIHSSCALVEVPQLPNSECHIMQDTLVNTSHMLSNRITSLSIDDTFPYKERKQNDCTKVTNVSRDVCSDSQQPLVLKPKEGNIAEDGSVSSGDHVTDPDMLASASASSTGSEMSWTSGGGPVARRDLLPLDEDQDEVQWRALLAVNPPDSDEERTGYESDEDFESMDAEMRRLEEKLRRFERELGENADEGEKAVPQVKPSGGPLLLRSQDLEALRISPLPEVYPAVSAAKTKHLSLMSRLQVQEYEESCSGSGSDSDDVASSEDSADFLFVKTKIKLKPGERKCRSLDQKRPKNDNILNESSKDGNDSKQPCACEEALDLSSLALPGETVDDESLCGGSNVPDHLDVPPPANFGNVSVMEHESQNETSLNVNPEAIFCDDEKICYDTPCFADDNMLLGYIWHEDDGMAAVDFEGLEDFYNYEGQGALMIMFEDDLDDDFTCEEILEERESQIDSRTHPKKSLPDDEWKSGANFVDSSSRSSSNKSERTFVSAFKNSLKKATKYLGPKSENSSKKIGTPTECQPFDWHDNNNTSLVHDISSAYPLLPSPLEEESSAGVYNVQSGQVTPVAVVSSHNDCDGRDMLSCSSGEYYASPAICVNTSDEDPVIPPAPVILPPAPPPRWVQWKPPLFKSNDVRTNECSVQDVSVYPPAVPPEPLQVLLPSRLPLPAELPPPFSHTESSTPKNDENCDIQFCIVGIPSTESPKVDSQHKDSMPYQDYSNAIVQPYHSVLNPDSADTFLATGGLICDNQMAPESCSEKFPRDSHCHCMEQIPVGCDDDISAHLPHIEDARHLPMHKPTSVKQLKRKQQEKIQRQEAEEGMAALGCTFCMGMPISRPRPPENSSHWRQSSPHPKAINDRRSWPPRK